MLRFLKTLFLLGLLAALGLAGAGWWWLQQPLALRTSPVDLSIEPGTVPRAVAQAVHDAGVDVNPDLLYAWFRVSGQDRQIRAGSHELLHEACARDLLRASALALAIAVT